jgi:hypothetical protein
MNPFYNHFSNVPGRRSAPAAFTRGCASSILLITFAMAAGACSGQSGDTSGSSEEEALRVTPIGSGTPAYLSVTGPAAPAPLNGAYFQLRRSHFGDLVDDGVQQPLGLTVPAAYGPVYLELRSSYLGGRIASGVFLELKTGKTMSIQAGGVRFLPSNPRDEVSGPRTLGTDHAQLMVGGSGPAGAYPSLSRLRDQEIKIDGASPQYMALLPGKYMLRYGIDSRGVSQGDGVDFEVLPGVMTDVIPWDYTQRRIRMITAPATRELPTFGGTNEYTYSCGGEVAYFTLANGEYIDVGRTTHEPPRLCWLKHPAWRLGFPISFGQVGVTPLRFERIDVDDVDVKQPDGTVKKVRGTYTVYGGPTLNDEYTDGLPTNTGLDVPAGRYRIDVEYATPQTGTKRTSSVIDL